MLLFATADVPSTSLPATVHALLRSHGVGAGIELALGPSTALLQTAQMRPCPVSQCLLEHPCLRCFGAPKQMFQR